MYSRRIENKDDAVEELNLARELCAKGKLTSAAFSLGKATRILKDLGLPLETIGLNEAKYNEFLQTMSEGALKALLLRQD